MASITSFINELVITSRHINSRICLRILPTCLNRLFQQTADLAFSVTPSQLTLVQEY